MHKNYIHRKLEHQWLQTKLSVNQLLYSDHCLLGNNRIFWKMQYYSNFIDNAGSDHNQLFNTIDRLLDRKPDILYSPCSSPSDLVDHFVGFFSTKITTISNSLARPVQFGFYSVWIAYIHQDPRLDCCSPTIVNSNAYWWKLLLNLVVSILYCPKYRSRASVLLCLSFRRDCQLVT